MNIFNALQKQFYISKEPIKQLETEYPCILCKVNARCYYIENIIYHGVPAYICKITYNQLKKYNTYINLINSLTKYVDNDCKNYILSFYGCLLNEVQCIKDKEAIIKYRNNYFNLDFITLYTIPQLKALITHRGLTCPNRKNLKQADYIKVLRSDMSTKYMLWRNDTNYPINKTYC
jgi:hypothetical protein